MSTPADDKHYFKKHFYEIESKQTNTHIIKASVTSLAAPKKMKFRGRDFMFLECVVSLSQGTRYGERHIRKLNRAEQTRHHGFDSSLFTSNRRIHAS